MCQNKVCLIYQYCLNRADKYQLEKKLALERLKRSKNMRPDEFLEVLESVYRAEFFEEVTSDLFKLLNF